MDVNDDVDCLNTRVVLTFFASELAPTADQWISGSVDYWLTTILPIICGCSAQKYSYSPGVLNTQE